MNQLQESVILAVKAFENKFQMKPNILQGHSRTLIIGFVNNISGLLESRDIKINFNDTLPTGEVYVGKFIDERFQSIQVK